MRMSRRPSFGPKELLQDKGPGMKDQVKDKGKVSKDKDKGFRA